MSITNSNRRIGAQGPVFLSLLAAIVAPMPRALAGPSHSASSYVVFGTRDEDHGRWESARDNFRLAVAKDHKSILGYIGLGRAYQHLGANERAHEAFGRALQIDPHRAEAENGWHETMAEADHEKWFAELATRAQQSPKDADAQATYAEELLERGRTDEAVTAANAALQLNPKLSHATCVLGRVALAAGRDDDAKRYLTEATRADRTDDDAWSALGDLEMKQKDYPGAIDAYRKAVKSAPEHAEYYDNLATALDAAGQHDDASEQRTLATRMKAELKSETPPSPT